MRTFVTIRGAALCLGTLLLLACPARAADHGLAAEFNWQNTSGNWLTAWGRLPDTTIKANYHTIKKSINDTVNPSLCGVGNTNYGLIKTYGLEFSGDGTIDYVLDETAYFSGGENANCPVRICQDVNNDGTKACTIALFKNNTPPTQVLTAGGLLCPPAAANKQCRSDCPATVANCPGLFKYDMTVVMSQLVFDWKFITPEAFQQIRASRTNIYGSLLYHELYNNNPVFVASIGGDRCTTEELQLSGAGSNRCYKYYQYAENVRESFIDLYAPSPQEGVGEEETRVTPTFFNRDAAQVGSAWRTSDTGIRLSAGSSLAFQIPNFVGLDIQEPSLCRQVVNNSSSDYNFPQRSDAEVASFLKAASAGNMPGVTQAECARQFTAWYGTTSCPAMACNQVITIGAERRCQRSSSAYGDCSECKGVPDTGLIPGYTTHQCTFEKVCRGAPCPPHHSCLPAETGILMADGSTKAIAEIKVGDSILSFKRNAPLAAPQPAKVKALMQTDERDLVWINELRITPGHPFLLTSGKVVSAKAVKVGDTLVGLSGETVQVTKVGPVAEKTKVYNFSLDDADGYIAGGLRVLSYPDLNN